MSSSTSDVKSLSSVNKTFYIAFNHYLWRTINLGDSKGVELETAGQDALEKLEKFCKLLDSNKFVAKSVHKIIVPSVYPIYTTVVHRSDATSIFSRLPNVTHIVVLRPRNNHPNMDVLNVQLKPIHNQPRIHRPMYCSFHTPAMVLRLPNKVSVCEGMFPDRETARAFLTAQSRSLRIWKGYHHRSPPFFLERGFTTPHLSSLHIMTEDRIYDKITESPILQASVRALEIGSKFRPQRIVPDLEFFKALESLAIHIPIRMEPDYLTAMSIALPQLRRLSLSSNGFVRATKSAFST